MADDNETTTTNSTTVNTGVDTTAQTQESAPNPSPVDAAPSTDLNASGSIASPAVTDPANDITTNDVEQTQEDRFADARTTAMVNHAAANGLDAANQSSATEEEIA
jgi:hypothetical protein